MREPVSVVISVPLEVVGPFSTRFELVAALISTLHHERFADLSEADKIAAMEAFHVLAKESAA